jgi:hypothetical protein
MRLDGLRLASGLDPDGWLYKDWLHLILFDGASGLVGIFNVALHGPPHDPRSRAVGTALVHLPQQGWLGNVETAAMNDVAVHENGVGLRNVALALDPGVGLVMASARLPDDRLNVDVTAQLDGPTHSVPVRMRLGSGWISWFAAPRLRPRGHVEAAGRTIDLSAAHAYHDHNWGRWRWGEDIGWEWGCFADQGGGPLFVYICTTDRDHRRRDRALLLVHTGGARRTFAGGTVSVHRAGQLALPPRRLPGALAALHGDRARPLLPAELELWADDGHDFVRLRFRASAAAQIVTAEPTTPGYGFIHEVAGSFEAAGRMNSKELHSEGLAVLEHVD